MAASTIPNSGGPGSSIELSPVTISVRDKVIEKFVDQPLDEMNESLKQLLSGEEDEQKRLGILAARVYILRQRISKIAEGDPDRVVVSAAPKANDMVSAGGEEVTAETSSGEWTRLRILEDCEVNGVRFPKTVIIDVKSTDAEKLIESGNAELVEEKPASTSDKTGDGAGDEAAAADAPPAAEAGDEAAAAAGEAEAVQTPDTTEPAETADTPEAAELPETEAAPDDSADDSEDDLSALSAALDEAPETPAAVEDEEQPAVETSESSSEAGGEAMIDAPSAAEVTAALEALSVGDTDDEAATEAADASTDAADVAAELESLSAALSPDGAEPGSDAADVAAELEAAAAAMAAGPANPDTADLPPAGGEDEADGEDAADKPAGWFEAQQNAEQSKRSEGKPDDEDS